MTLRPRFGLPFAFAAIAALLLSAAPAFGQVTTGDLLGLVTIKSDKSPLPGVSVEAIHVPTQTRYTAVTSASGRFAMLNVRVGGPYTVTAKIGGFKTETLKDIYRRPRGKARPGIRAGARARAADRRRDGQGDSVHQPGPDGLRPGGFGRRDQGPADHSPAVPGLRPDEPLRQRAAQRFDADDHLHRGNEQPVQHDPDRRRGQQRPVRARLDRHPGRPDGHAAHLARHHPGDPGRHLPLRHQAGRVHRRRHQRDHAERDERLPRLRLRLEAERELHRQQCPAGPRRRARQADRDLRLRPARRPRGRTDPEGQALLLRQRREEQALAADRRVRRRVDGQHVQGSGGRRPVPEHPDQHSTATTRARSGTTTRGRTATCCSASSTSTSRTPTRCRSGTTTSTP